MIVAARRWGTDELVSRVKGGNGSDVVGFW